jgi:hypothetical protein
VFPGDPGDAGNNKFDHPQIDSSLVKKITNYLRARERRRQKKRIFGVTLNNKFGVGLKEGPWSSRSNVTPSNSTLKYLGFFLDSKLHDSGFQC